MAYVKTLGRLAVLRSPEDTDASLLGSGKPTALLAYLTCQPRRAGSRDVLADLLWGDTGTTRSRHSLRQAVLVLRRALGDDVVGADPVMLVCDPSVTCDRDVLLRAIQDDDVATALSCYEGDFLATFAAPDTIDFEHWAEVERASLREAFLQALARWARQAMDARDFAAAGDLCRRGLTLAPERESLWRLLIESHVLSGSAPLAFAAAHRLHEAAAADGRDLEPATVHLLRRLETARAATSPPDRSKPAPVEFIGREREFASLLAAWDAARKGRRTVMSICGGAGLGKSRLLDELAHRLQVVGARVGRVRGRLGERDIAFSLAGELAAALGRLPGAAAVSPAAADALVGLAPVLSTTFSAAHPDRGDDSEAVRRRASALLELCEAVAAERSLAILIDDLHWADPVSSRVLDMVLARLEGPVLVVLATRDPVALSSHVDAARLVLEPLDRSQVEALIGSMGQLPAAPWVESWIDEVVASSKGVPLHVIQLVIEATEHGVLRLESGAFQSPDPERLRELTTHGAGLRLRIERLSAQAQQVLAILSAASTAIPEAAVVTALGAPAGTCEELLAMLEASGLARSTDAGVELGHDVIGDEVASVVPSVMRVSAARSLGRALLGDGTADMSTLRLAARLLVEAQDWASLGELATAWLRIRRVKLFRPTARELHALLGDAVAPGVVAHVQANMPWRTRWFTGAMPVAAALAAVMLIGATRAMTDSRNVGAPAGLHLEVVTQPIADTTGPFMVGPVVEVLDANGAPVDASVPVSVSLVRLRGQGSLTGRLTERATHGVAHFDSLFLNALNADWQLRFEAPHMRAVVSEPTGPHVSARLFVLGGRLNGMPVDSLHPSTTVAAGDSLTGELSVRFRTVWSSGIVILAGTPTWGNPRDNARFLKVLPTPVASGIRSVPVAFKAPRRPGAYEVILVVTAEPDEDHALSGTNWVTGPARWGDGNDVAQWSPEQLMAARDSGFTIARIFRHDADMPRAAFKAEMVGAAVIDVTVTGGPPVAQGARAGR